MKNRIGFISLGCCKNLVDAEHMITLLQKNGYRIAGNYQDSDLIVVNTCGFINPSIEESVESIREALDTGKPVVVTGCLGARHSYLSQLFNHPNLVGFNNCFYDVINSNIVKLNAQAPILPLKNTKTELQKENKSH